MSQLAFTQDQIPFFMSPKNGLYSGGQPTLKAFQQLAQSGLNSIINLRPDSELQGFDEKSLVESLGMRYEQLAIDGADDINFANAERLHQLLASMSGDVLIHCASGNRVGALLALDAAKHQGLSVDEAVAYGKKGGLTKAEDKIRAMLS